jgi:hypothetical protein
MKTKLSITALYQIYKSDKDFILYRLSEDKKTILDFVLTNDLSRHRAHFNGQFKLVADIQKQIKKSLKIEL